MVSLAIAALLLAGAERPSLRGVVEGPAGIPLAGAKVTIYAAHPRSGTTSFCPSCYEDCGRSAATAANGHFDISALDPTLAFDLVATAPGKAPLFRSGVDPSAGNVVLALEPPPPRPSDPRRIVRGRVAGPRGPAAGAVVEPLGAATGGSVIFSSAGAPATVTDEQGAFEIVLAEPVDSLLVMVSPSWLARRTASVPTGQKPTTIAVTAGVGVRGRVTKGGRPLGNVIVDMTQKDRDRGRLVGTYSAITNDVGQFLISNVLPDETLVVVGSSESLGGVGYTASRELTTGPDGTTADIGDLEVKPGHRVAGRIILKDNGALPAEARVTIARKDVDDPQSVPLRPDGSFEFQHVPEGVLDLAVSLSGYVLSSRNASLLPAGGSLLRGRVDRDLRLTVLVEKGSPATAESQEGGPSDSHRVAVDALAKRPLAGIGEAKDQGSDPPQ